MKHICVAILAKDKAHTLPLYLECLERQEYPKQYISIYIRTNNNNDNTTEILREWTDKNRLLYNRIELDDSDVKEQVQLYEQHFWNAERFTVLGRIRNESIKKAIEWDCDFYFVADCDNFITPPTLYDLTSLNLPIVAPRLRLGEDLNRYYSNYHCKVDDAGYYKDDENYLKILYNIVTGIIEVDCVHCTYMIRRDCISKLYYLDETERHEYVIFSESARKNNVKQFITNIKDYGYLTFKTGKPEDEFPEKEFRNLLKFM